MKRFVLASDTLPSSSHNSLVSLGYTPLLLPSYQRLQKGVSSHPDMLVFFFGNEYLCTKEYYLEAKRVFDQINDIGYTPIPSDELHKKEYPYDVLLNALSLGDSIYGLSTALSKKLIELANKRNIKIINVRQGYTKCSVCKVGENAIITADDGIAQVAQMRGVEVLKIRPGHIRLDGYDCGFIGGASGSDGNAVYFCGDVMKHPDGYLIEEFCRNHSKACISLSDDTLFDVGTLFFL